MKLFIASFGFQDVIQQILEYYKIKGIFTEIVTPGKFPEYEDGYAMDNKNEMLSYICEKHGLKRPFLIDDSNINVKEAFKIYKTGFWIQPEKGISLEESKKIENRIKEDKPDCIVFDADLTLFKEHVTSEFVYPMIQNKKDITSFPCHLVHLSVGFLALLEKLKL